MRQKELFRQSLSIWKKFFDFSIARPVFDTQNVITGMRI